jgi:hypothetical protein
LPFLWQKYHIFTFSVWFQRPQTKEGQMSKYAAAFIYGTLLILPSLARAQVFATEEQIKRALVGNTISGQERGVPYVEYFEPGGRIEGEGPDGHYVGRWTISNGRMCLSYEQGEGATTAWDCARVGVEGDKILWAAPGERSYSMLTAGNPKGF